MKRLHLSISDELLERFKKNHPDEDIRDFAKKSILTFLEDLEEFEKFRRERQRLRRL